MPVYRMVLDDDEYIVEEKDMIQAIQTWQSHIARLTGDNAGNPFEGEPDAVMVISNDDIIRPESGELNIDLGKTK